MLMRRMVIMGPWWHGMISRVLIQGPRRSTTVPPDNLLAPYIYPLLYKSSVLTALFHQLKHTPRSLRVTNKFRAINRSAPPQTSDKVKYSPVVTHPILPHPPPWAPQWLPVWLAAFPLSSVDKPAIRWPAQSTQSATKKIPSSLVTSQRTSGANFWSLRIRRTTAVYESRPISRASR
jgi:hypothetical protein